MENKDAYLEEGDVDLADGHVPLVRSDRVPEHWFACKRLDSVCLSVCLSVSARTALVGDILDNTTPQKPVTLIAAITHSTRIT